MFTHSYSAICDVPEETVRQVTALLHANRRRIGIRPRRCVGTERTQAKLVLRWFRDDAPVRRLAHEGGMPISTVYRYLHEAIERIADQAPDLHEVLDRVKANGWSHVSVDGTLIETDRVGQRNDKGIICGTRASTRGRAPTYRFSRTRPGFRCGRVQ